MGKWTLESITATDNNRDNDEEFGTNFKVTLRLAYAPSNSALTRAFKEIFLKKESPVMKESPMLVWHETITALEHHKNSYWTFATDMFQLKPASKTFEVWRKRYIAAYGFVTENPIIFERGTVQFYNKKGGTVSRAKFARKPAGSDEQKAAVTRKYLGKHGGVFVIEIHDVPMIMRRLHEHVQREVLFECGLEGERQRVKAMQYLNVNTDQPPNSWQRRFEISASASFSRIDLPIQDLRQDEPPDRVTRPARLLTYGESL